MNATPPGSSDDAIAGWLRSATGQLNVNPPIELLPTALATVPAIRRHRRLTAALAAGAAALAAVVIGTGVLLGGQADSHTTIMPAAGSPTITRGTAPAPPIEVPTAAGDQPLRLRYVDAPRLLTLTDAQRDEIDAHCAPEATTHFVAIADRWGLQVLLSGDDGGAMCRTFNGPATTPDLTGINGPILWPAGRHNLTKPPTNPIDVFNSGDDSSGTLGAWNARQWAAGQVSPQVALLVAALPTGDAVIVPFEPSTGVFITRIQITTPDLSQYQAIRQMPLTLYAYSTTGTLLAQSTPPTCDQMPICPSQQGPTQTHLPSPLTSPPATSTPATTSKPATPTS